MYLDGDLFKKYFKARNKDLEQKELVRQVIFEIVGIEVVDRSLKIKNNTITVLVSPIQKSEILLQSESILQKLKERGYSFGTIL